MRHPAAEPIDPTSTSERALDNDSSGLRGAVIGAEAVAVLRDGFSKSSSSPSEFLARLFLRKPSASPQCPLRPGNASNVEQMKNLFWKIQFATGVNL